MDVVEKALGSVQAWEDVAKGDYDGHPFRGNKYVDEFGNPRANTIMVSNPFGRDARAKRARNKEMKEYEKLLDAAEAGDEEAKAKLKEIEEADLEAEKKDKVQKARKKKDEGGPPYDEDFNGNQYVDKHGNPQTGHSRVRRAGNKAMNAAIKISRMRKLLHGSGLKISIDTQGRPVISTGYAKLGTAEFKTDPKTGVPLLRVKPAEKILQLRPNQAHALQQFEAKANREARREARRRRSYGKVSEENQARRQKEADAKLDIGKPKKKVKKDYKESVLKGYRAVGKISVYKGDKFGHDFRGNQWVHDDGTPRVGRALGVAGAVAGVGGTYRLARDKKIVNRRRDLFAANFTDKKLNILGGQNTHVPRSQIANVIDDVKRRRASTMAMTGQRNIAVTANPRTHMEARWRLLSDQSAVPDMRRTLQSAEDKLEFTRKKLAAHRESMRANKKKDSKRARNTEARLIDERKKAERAVKNAKTRLKPFRNVTSSEADKSLKLLARSADTNLVYAKDRIKRIPSYLKRGIKYGLFRRF